MGDSTPPLNLTVSSQYPAEINFCADYKDKDPCNYDDIGVADKSDSTLCGSPDITCSCKWNSSTSNKGKYCISTYVNNSWPTGSDGY